MLINFPNQLTSEEEQLLKKIAKMKKKKKLFSEKNKNVKEKETSLIDSQPSTAQPTTPSNLKRPNTNTTAVGKQIDAKEAAKKLVQSGVIKFETENKEKGFKRSCSRKDDPKKMSFGNNETSSYSSASISSPNSALSPPISANSPFYNNNRFNFQTDHQQSPQSSQGNRQFRQKSFQNTFNSSPSGQGGNFDNYFQGGGSGGGGPRFQQNNFNNQQQQNGIKLFIKANNVTEELLRSLFNANVSQAKIISIDVKTNFAFVTVDTKEAAENAIQELNDKTFQDSLFSVSLARPKAQFNRNNSYSSGYERSNSGTFSQNFNQNSGQNTTSASNISSSPSKVTGSGSQGDLTSPSSNSTRQIINYEDIQ